ncbi:type II CRISPR RNA-guided endonuclease Cas9 [Peijinzhouia sedimentorum]
MALIFSFDLGTNSIGGAVIDSTKKKILWSGVNIFPMGVVNLGDGQGREMSKNATRRIARGVRKQIYRRKLRKKLLLKHLIRFGMCPVTLDELDVWKNEKQFPKSKEVIEWFKINPYELRDRAINGELTKHELGRVFYHLAQRRGFQSNSRSVVEDEGTLYDGKPAEGKTGINETIAAKGDKTLGQYLHSIQPKEFKPFENGKPRIRNRYTTRKMYTEEFDAIWEKQAAILGLANKTTSVSKTRVIGNPNTKRNQRKITKLNADGVKFQIQKDEKNPANTKLKIIREIPLKEFFGGGSDSILFYQRPLKSQKGLIAKCPIEPSKKRVPISAIPFEKFRAWQFINSIECNGIKLDQKDREILFEELLTKEKPKFSALRKKLKKSDATYKFNYEDSTTAPGCYTISKLASTKCFGKKWFEKTDKEQDEIWHILYFFTDKSNLKEYATNNYHFDEEQAEYLSKLNLKDGFGNLSRKAINNILPFLEMGFTYDKATTLGGVKNCFGEKWNELSHDQIDLIITNVPEIIDSKLKGGYIRSIKDFLSTEFDIPEITLNKLYHHSVNLKNTGEILNKLPLDKEADKAIMDLRNPIVATALFQLRRLVNKMLERFGQPDEVKLEMARDLKNSAKKRNEIRNKQSFQERKNEAIKKELAKLKLFETPDNILKYKLWEECQRKCPFSGNPISITQLFSGEVQIEHIFPWSRSLDDSYLNKTLCFAKENAAKGNRTPFEYYSEQGSDKWEEVKLRALKLFQTSPEWPERYNKFKRFAAEKFEDDSFIQRQLNDTRYISREAQNYLKKICPTVIVAPGSMTAHLRHLWGLNKILKEDQDQKDRGDHRHHAIDAIALACFSRAQLNEMSRWNRYDRKPNVKKFPEPWPGFWADAYDSIHGILVYHKPNRKVLSNRIVKTEKLGKVYQNLGVAARGQLHKESVYGKNTAPGLSKAYHIRKPLSKLTTKGHISKVVDMRIKKLLEERIQEVGGYEGPKKDQIPSNKNVFFDSDKEGNQIPMVYLPNKNGEPVPILKVRMRENFSKAEQLKDFEPKSAVDPQNNHHVLIYIDNEGKYKDDVITFWKAAERKRQGIPIVSLPEDGVKMVVTLQENDMFIIGYEGELRTNSKNINNYLYRVQKISKGDYNFRLALESSLNSSSFPEVIRIRSLGENKAGWQTLKPVKVKINELGEIEKTHLI